MLRLEKFEKKTETDQNQEIVEVAVKQKVLDEFLKANSDSIKRINTQNEGNKGDV